MSWRVYDRTWSLVKTLDSIERYEVEQLSPTADVTLAHPLGRRVSVTLLDVVDGVQRFGWWQNVGTTAVRFRFNGTKTFRAIMS